MAPLRIIQSITYKANIWIHLKPFKNRIFFFTGKQCITLVLPINSFPPVSFWTQGETEASRSYLLRYLLQEIGFPDCGGWLGDSEIQRAGRQEGQAGNSQAWAEAVARWNFFFFREASVVLLNLSPDWISLSSASKTFHLTESGWPRQPVRISLV